MRADKILPWNYTERNRLLPLFFQLKLANTSYRVTIARITR